MRRICSCLTAIPLRWRSVRKLPNRPIWKQASPISSRRTRTFFITSDQFSYTAAVDGIMLRKKPAANFFMGSYFAESLLLTETGASTGAIQIAGTDSDHQLPFFVTTCDYTLDRRGTLRGQRLSLQRTDSSRHAARTGHRQGAHPRRDSASGPCWRRSGWLLEAQWPQLFLDLFKDVK